MQQWSMLIQLKWIIHYYFLIWFSLVVELDSLEFINSSCLPIHGFKQMKDEDENDIQLNFNQ